MPPEILGCIFAWSLAREPGRSLYSPHFDGLHKGSYNFLLVCHHWFEVASRTTELWSFWGNSLQDWQKRHRRSGTSPLDLVLDGYKSDPDARFDESLQSAVRAHAIQNTIRQVHLRSDYGETVAAIISSLTPGDDEAIQNQNIESIVWQNERDYTADMSDFFARSRLLRLRVLDLHGSIRILSWDHLAPRTIFLTDLSLNIDISPSLPTITTAQLFSILTSNPNLRNISLSSAVIPNDTDASTFKVQLPNLNSLGLTGESRHVFGLLCQLALQGTLDDMQLSGFNPTAEDISQTLAPYIQDYFRRGPGFQGRLGVYYSSSSSTISISVGVVCTQTTAWVLEPPFVSLRIVFDFPPQDVLDQFLISLTTLIPRERVVSFQAWLDAWPLEEIFLMMPKIEALHLICPLLSEGFLQPNAGGPHANVKLFPSLRSLCLEHAMAWTGGDWSHLMTYLAHQTSDGQTISLEVIGDFPHDCPEIVDGIRSLVQEFTYPRNPVAEENE